MHVRLRAAARSGREIDQVFPHQPAELAEAQAQVQRQVVRDEERVRGDLLVPDERRGFAWLPKLAPRLGG